MNRRPPPLIGAAQQVAAIESAARASGFANVAIVQAALKCTARDARMFLGLAVQSGVLVAVNGGYYELARR